MMQRNSDKKTNIKKGDRDFVLVIIWIPFIFILSFLCWFRSEDRFSESERRVLKTFPQITTESLLDGKFMKDFESYSLDQFPFRDTFRGMKAMASYFMFKNKENNGIYMADGYLSKVEYPMEPKMLDYAVEHFEKIYNTYLKENSSKCYFVMIPDKNYFMAANNGYLSINYDDMFSYMEEKMYFTEYIDITHLLSLEDYYKTDTHWRQEKITDVAEYLEKAMERDDKERQWGFEKKVSQEITEENKESLIKAEYEIKELETPFYGVYCGQAALPVKPDRLYYLNSEILKKCEVTNLDTGKVKKTVVYNLEKATGNDAYEIFLSGASALLVIENPEVTEERELVVFRDSFGSSLIPLLVSTYSKITMIDTRYVNSSMLGNLVDFHGQDVLFLYSTLILNNSMSMR